MIRKIGLWLTAAASAAVLTVFASCNLYYGELGGADATTQASVAAVMRPLRGTWYSHYAGKRLDGYRIGQWGVNGAGFAADLGPERMALFPGYDGTLYQGAEALAYRPHPDDYYIFYDDTVYGQGSDGSGTGNGGWQGLTMRFAGIVRSVNTFNGRDGAGAIIIQYFKGCCPAWSPDVKDGQRPFFGVYYRVLSPNIVQMANAVILENLYKGIPYYTEQATLEAAQVINSAENDGEFISWGVVVPQDREGY